MIQSSANITTPILYTNKDCFANSYLCFFFLGQIILVWKWIFCSKHCPLNILPQEFAFFRHFLGQTRC